MNQSWLGIGAIFGFLSVALGAFGAHALSGRLSEKYLAIYHTAVQYQMYHSLALLALGLWMQSHSSPLANLSGWAFLIGILIFSGSLYALSLTEIRVLGAITPIGGVAFLIGWATFAFAALKS